MLLLSFYNNYLLEIAHEWLFRQFNHLFLLLQLYFVHFYISVYYKRKMNDYIDDSISYFCRLDFITLIFIFFFITYNKWTVISTSHSFTSVVFTLLFFIFTLISVSSSLWIIVSMIQSPTFASEIWIFSFYTYLSVTNSKRIIFTKVYSRMSVNENWSLPFPRLSPFQIKNEWLISNIGHSFLSLKFHLFNFRFSFYYI
mgnify:FL=1